MAESGQRLERRTLMSEPSRSDPPRGVLGSRGGDVLDPMTGEAVRQASNAAGNRNDAWLAPTVPVPQCNRPAAEPAERVVVVAAAVEVPPPGVVDGLRGWATAALGSVFGREERALEGHRSK